MKNLIAKALLGLYPKNSRTSDVKNGGRVEVKVYLHPDVAAKLQALTEGQRSAQSACVGLAVETLYFLTETEEPTPKTAQAWNKAVDDIYPKFVGVTIDPGQVSKNAFTLGWELRPSVVKKEKGS